MKLKVLAVERDGEDKTRVVLSVSAPYNAVISSLVIPGEELVLNRSGDAIQGGCVREPAATPAAPGGRVINRAADILGSAERE